jgi:hypothetical protein
MSGPRSSPTRFDSGPPSPDTVIAPRGAAGMYIPSAGLQFLLVAYVGTSWAQERERDTTQRERLTALATSRCQGHRQRDGVSPLPCALHEDGEDGEDEGGRS